MTNDANDNFNELEKETQILNEILSSKEKTESLIFQVKRLAKDSYLQKQRQKDLSQDIKDSAENFGLKASTLKPLITAVENDELEKAIQKGTAMVDVLTVINDEVSK